MNPQNQAVQAVMGMALPQTVIPVTKTETQVQRTQYNPNKLQAVLDALRTPRTVADNRKSAWEIFGNALANIEPVRNSTGAYGMEVANPYIQGLNSFARSFGGAYSARKENERDVRNAELEAQNMAREDAIKATQIAMDADKQVITDQTALDYMKYNDPNGGGVQQQQQRDAALSALRELNELAKGGEINALNKSTKNWGLAASSSKNIGRREQALSALLPLTNSIARASGGSGINTIGEMLAYLGVPENATSAQIEGALPGLINKLGFTPEEVYQMSMANNGGLAF